VKAGRENDHCDGRCIDRDSSGYHGIAASGMGGQAEALARMIFATKPGE
jgi:hypothetical protein